MLSSLEQLSRSSPSRLAKLPSVGVLFTATVLVTVVALGALIAWPSPIHVTWRVQPSSAASATPSPSPEPTTPSPAPAPADLPVIDYGPAPAGFPADPDPYSTGQLTTAAHPESKIPTYDALGGQARAFLAPTINGVSITMPIVDRKLGWVAILLPSVNRTIGWLPPTGWTEVPIQDQLVIRRGSHELSWLRSGVLQRTWSVTLGLPKTPTPLGRTFVLGRSRLPGTVYAGVDVMALGAVPDNVAALPAGLRGAHIGIHTWYNDYTLGKDASDGCIRLTKSGQELLLAEVTPGSPVVVID